MSVTFAHNYFLRIVCLYDWVTPIFLKCLQTVNRSQFLIFDRLFRVKPELINEPVLYF